MNKKLRVVVYCRVSTSEDSQKLSFETQKTYYEQYVNLNPNWELKKIYADRGVSGTLLNSKREQFNQMLLDCGIEVIQTRTEFSVKETNNKSLYDLIVVKDEKRFARNVDINSVIKHLRNKGVGVYFETLNINTLEKDDVTLKLLFAMSEDFSKNLSKNLKISYERAHLQNPKILGKSAPFGYMFGRNEKKERTLIPINQNYIDIIQDIFNMYINGDGFRVIAKYVNDKGFKTENGNQIEKYTIERIIKNEKYMGYIQVIRHNAESINTYGHTLRKYMHYDLIKSDKIIPIVTEDTWNKANEKLNNKDISKDLRGIKYQKSKYSKKLFCMNCYQYYIKTKDSKRNDVYVCSSKREKLGNADNCKSPYVSEQFLDEYLNNLLKDNNFIKEEKAKLQADIDYFEFFKYSLISTFFDERDTSLIDDLKSQIKKIEDEQDEMFNRHKEIPDSVLIRNINSLEEEKKVLQTRLDKEEFSFEEFKKELKIINDTIDRFKNYNFDKVKTHKELLDLIEIEIKPNSPDSKIKQKRNDCTLSYRSIFQNDYQEYEYRILDSIKHYPSPKYQNRINANIPYTAEERQELDKKITDLL